MKGRKKCPNCGWTPPVRVNRLLAKRLRTAREFRGLTQRELGFASGFCHGDIGSWERGVRQPSKDKVAIIEEALAIPIGVIGDSKKFERFLKREARRSQCS